ncbi:MAG TPA: hypothetical protein VGF70_11550 [Solirubrobacteraceae bacterium]
MRRRLGLYPGKALAATLAFALIAAAPGALASGGGTGTGGGGTSGGGGGTPPPPLSSNPCASITPSSVGITRTFVNNNLDTTISSCSSATMTNLVVAWDPGPGGGPAVTCVAPQGNVGNGFSLSPGASLRVTCQTVLVNSGTFAAGTGTVSVYANCEAFNVGAISTLDQSLSCNEIPSSLLAQAPFSWNIAVPATPPANPNLPGHRG